MPQIKRTWTARQIRATRVPMSAKKLGELGEMAFTLHASMRGFTVAAPYGDCEAYDRLVDNGKRCLRVQIKTTGQNPSTLRHIVNCGHTDTRRGPGIKRVPYSKEEVDFVAIFVIHDSVWHIIPWKALDGRMKLVIYSGSRSHLGKFAQYRNSWDLLWKRSGPRGKAKRQRGLVIDRIMACEDTTVPQVENIPPQPTIPCASPARNPVWILTTGQLPSPEAVARILDASNQASSSPTARPKTRSTTADQG